VGSWKHLLFEEAAGIQEVVQTALGLGRLKVPGGLDPLTAMYNLW